MIAGVCTGLSAYADFALDWTRVIFLVLTILTGGAFLLVYVVLIFILPVVETRQQWVDLMTAPKPDGDDH